MLTRRALNRDQLLDYIKLVSADITVASGVAPREVALVALPAAAVRLLTAKTQEEGVRTDTAICTGMLASTTVANGGSNR